MPTKPPPHRITPAEWKARYAEIQRQTPTLARRKRPDEPKTHILELEYALANPPPFAWRTLKAPSDPAFAFRALYAFCEGLPSDNT